MEASKQRQWSRDLEPGGRFVFPEANVAITVTVSPKNPQFFRVVVDQLPPQRPPRLTRHRRKR